jgi:hypothetical protein
MSTTVYVLLAVVVVTTLYFGVMYVTRTIRRFRGQRIITCPETAKPAHVEVDAVHAAFTSMVGRPELSLASCSRWPMKQDCGQECLAQLDVAPSDCVVGSVLSKWYRNKECFFCHKHFSEVQWSEHRPALQSPEGVLVKWSDVPLNNLMNVMATHQPVCWDCYIAQSFAREHPELVVYRPWPEARKQSINN